MIDIPSPAVAFVGRCNSGKTTLTEKVIAELVARGLDVGSVKHHSHAGFDIDYPGKDSYRHHQAGASETCIAAPGRFACVKEIEGELECSQIVRSMPGHDIVIVEGYRRSGLPVIEVMRQGNPADVDFAQRVCQRVEQGCSKTLPELGPETIAFATDVPCAIQAASALGLPVFSIDDVSELVDFLVSDYARPRLTVAIQAGGESSRMGQSKATVQFGGRPMICRIIERVKEVADELIITTNKPDELAFLKDQYPDKPIRLVRDVMEFRGALPGIFSALSAASNDYVAIVACDMVCVSPALIVEEAQRMKAEDADVVVPVNKHGYEPFHAMYRRSRCVTIIRSLLATGCRRAQAFFHDVRLCGLTQEEVLAIEPMGGCFMNANTLDELRSIEESIFSS